MQPRLLDGLECPDWRENKNKELLATISILSLIGSDYGSKISELASKRTA